MVGGSVGKWKVVGGSVVSGFNKTHKEDIYMCKSQQAPLEK